MNGCAYAVSGPIVLQMFCRIRRTRGFWHRRDGYEYVVEDSMDRWKPAMQNGKILVSNEEEEKKATLYK